MKFFDRLVTITITVVLTSAVWFIAGPSFFNNAFGDGRADKTGAGATQLNRDRSTQNGGSPDMAEASAKYVDQSVQQETVSQSVNSQTNTGDAGQLTVPVANIKRTDLTDTYTASRGRGERLHEAIDIMAPTGTNVVAAAPGVIEKLFISDAGGKTIYVRSADKRTIHYYAHLDQYAASLKEGQKVRQGQRLGTVGSSGNASVDAPHLHFAIMRTKPSAKWWEPSSPINPYPLLMGTASP